jgi:apolipoprotein N-acyltransferase
MNENQMTYPQKDRWSYLWLVIGTLVLLLWRMPLAWWLAPIFLMRFTRTQRVWTGFFLVWLAGFLTGILPMYGILNALIPMPLWLFLIVTALFALMNTAFPYLADRLLAPRLKGFTATFVFPLMITTMSYIGAKANPAGSIGGMAYFQYSNLVLLQLLSITGMWGIVFLVTWLGPVINYAWERDFTWKTIRRNVLVYVLIMLSVFLYGGIRLAYPRQASSTVRVHGFTAVDMRQEGLEKLHSAEAQNWQDYRQVSADYQTLYLEGTLREAQAGAQIVHWPEMAANLPKEDEANFLDQAREIVMDEGIYLVMGYSTSHQDGSRGENKLVILDPAGKIILEHNKYALAAMEGKKSGDGILHTAETSFGTLSGIICNDTYHEEVVAQAGRNGTDILFSPTLGYRQTDPLQAHMAMFRAIENGLTHIRQADNGLSIVVDPYGRFIAATDHFTSSERVMVAQVPLLSTFTIYPYIGDLFAWLAIAALAVLIVIGIIRGREKSAAP